MDVRDEGEMRDLNGRLTSMIATMSRLQVAILRALGELPPECDGEFTLSEEDLERLLNGDGHDEA